MSAANLRVAATGSVLLLGFLAASVVTAHPDLEIQIRDLTVRIENDPQNPTLWIQRGELHRIHHSWPEAESDFRQARKIQPDLEVVDYLLGRMNLDAGRPKQAKKSLDRFLAAQPEHAKARVTRARALARLGQPLAAAGDYTRAIDAFNAASRATTSTARARSSRPARNTSRPRCGESTRASSAGAG
jgi:predicted Zn-dependent protease